MVRCCRSRAPWCSFTRRGIHGKLKGRRKLALNDAMSFRKVKQMREMLVIYRELDPKDVELGYGRVTRSHIT